MSSIRAIAIVSAFNEADVIEQTVQDLVSQGVAVYLIDDGSDDGTADLIEPLLGRGVVGIERVAKAADSEKRFRLRSILARKEELARTLDADWFINHDADEIRESPWMGVGLTDAIDRVDRLGCNAIDFAVLNFAPVNDSYQRGDDLRGAFPYYSPGLDVDRIQVRCWKRQRRVDLLSTGGHEARFDGREVFPVRFLLKHYPVRSQAHGMRKVFCERLPRYDLDERQLGWHVQYEKLGGNHVFLRRPDELRRFDPVEARIDLCLRNRTVEQLEDSRLELQRALTTAVDDGRRAQERGAQLDHQLTQAAASAEAATLEGQRLTSAFEVALQAGAARLADGAARIAELETGLLETQGRLQRKSDDAEQLKRLLDRSKATAIDCGAQLEVVRTRLNAVEHSRTWRWTAPLRRVASLVGLR